MQLCWLCDVGGRRRPATVHHQGDYQWLPADCGYNALSWGRPAAFPSPVFLSTAKDWLWQWHRQFVLRQRAPVRASGRLCWFSSVIHTLTHTLTHTLNTSSTHLHTEFATSSVFVSKCSIHPCVPTNQDELFQKLPSVHCVHSSCCCCYSISFRFSSPAKANEPRDLMRSD